MIDFSNCSMQQVIVHRVGNKLRDEGIIFSKQNIELDKGIKDLLLNYFLSPFKGLEFYNFTHLTDLRYNEVFNFSRTILNSANSIIESSNEIAKHLYEVSTHPQVKGGELYIVRFKDILIEDELVDGLGIFKSENRDTYLKVEPTSQSFDFISDKGINLTKLDKGCLVLNTEVDKGYKVQLVNGTNRKEEAQFWMNDFLNLRPAQNDYFLTNNFLSLTKDFVQDQINSNKSLDKTDQADILNKSMNFFKENKEFDHDQFINTVLEKPDLIDSFRRFETQFQEENEMEIPNSFEISEQAVKKKSRVFKSVLKLDKNFHIYIHGNRNLIEKGVDPDSGKKFYKIYYDHED